MIKVKKIVATEYICVKCIQLPLKSIQSEGVINLFQDFERGFSLFDPNFLEKIEKMEQKNLSVELLNKLLTDEIRSIVRQTVQQLLSKSHKCYNIEAMRG